MSDDQPRQAAASSDTEYSLSIDEVAALYEGAGLPRDRRTLQRYCAKGSLDCHRVEIAYGEKYLVTPASVATHIAYIKEVRQVATNHGGPRLVAAMHVQENQDSEDTERAATTPDKPRPVAADDEMMSRYVAHLEGENSYLREQNTAKDGQIKDLTERARETNHLIAGLQKMLTPLLGRGGASSSDHDARNIASE
jgi:hypothetical protein